MIDPFYWWPPQLDKKQIKQINKFIIGENVKKITDKNILSLMRYYELTKELKACTSTAKVKS